VTLKKNLTLFDKFYPLRNNMKLQWKDEIRKGEYKYYILKRQTPTLRPFLDAHAHDYAEIFYVERGTFTHQVNQKEYSVLKGDILFIPPNVASHCVKNYDKNTSLLQILFPIASFSFIKSRYAIPEWKMLWDTENAEPFHLHLTQQQWFESNFNHLLLSDNSLFEIERFLMNMLGLLRDYNKTKAEKYSDNWLDRALKEIQEPKNFKLGVQGFASLCRRSPEHVEREVKKRTNQTITDVINKAKMNWASYMLIFSEVEIIDIVDGCGFNSISYFYKLFHDFYGISPSAYRKSLRDHTDTSLNKEFIHYMDSIPEYG
jgi:AraC family transcriptional regulator, dual regulator of chb operon